jgi:hypothetical protein
MRKICVTHLRTGSSGTIIGLMPVDAANHKGTKSDNLSELTGGEGALFSALRYGLEGNAGGSPSDLDSGD